MSACSAGAMALPELLSVGVRNQCWMKVSAPSSLPRSLASGYRSTVTEAARTDGHKGPCTSLVGAAKVADSAGCVEATERLPYQPQTPGRESGRRSPGAASWAYYPSMSGARDCTCENHCPAYDHCICLYDYELGVCRVRCNDNVAEVKTLAVSDAGGDEGAKQVNRKSALGNHVKLEMHDASLGDVSRLLAETIDAEIFVPADRLDERRDMYKDDVSLETLVRELGLMAVLRP